MRNQERELIHDMKDQIQEHNQPERGTMKGISITCISDLHGHYPKLDGGDLLIVSGDLTANDTQEQFDEFDSWLAHLPYTKKIFIGGNHDNFLIKEQPRKYLLRTNGKQIERFEYCCDSGTEFHGLKIWGSPWTLKFKGQSPKAMAFTCDTEEELAEKWAMIPDDTDILITHSPPKMGLDKVNSQEHVGSASLATWIFLNQPKLHVFGHIHENYGKIESKFLQDLCKYLHISIGKGYQTTLVNASHVNEHYEPVNKPIRIEL